MSRVTRPDELVGQPLPDLTLPSSRGEAFALRQFVGVQAIALFFYIRNSTPG